MSSHKWDGRTMGFVMEAVTPVSNNAITLISFAYFSIRMWIFFKKIRSGCQYIKGVEGRNRYHMDLFFIGDSENSFRWSFLFFIKWQFFKRKQNLTGASSICRKKGSFCQSCLQQHERDKILKKKIYIYGVTGLVVVEFVFQANENEEK